MKHDKYLLLACTIFMMHAGAQHPFKYDHTIYNTVYLNEAFHMMDSMQNYLLLDVRTPGEYADTSYTTALNIGRLRGSVNLTVDSVPAHLEALKKYMDQPVFIYCSHSQRSRRMSKLLAENGFKKVYNINGGMTQLNELDASAVPDKARYLVTNLDYRNISSPDAYHLIQDTPGLVILDIRTGPEFASRDSLQGSNIGHLKNAINIPQAEFAEKFEGHHIPANSVVLLYDQHGYNSMDVVYVLKAKGFTRIYNLFEGLEGFMADNRLSKIPAGQIFSDPPPYKILDTKSSIDLIEKKPDLVILDTRPTEEFSNQAKRTYLNLGHIRGAVPVHSIQQLQAVILKKDKETEFLVYGSGTDTAAFISAYLVKSGYRRVNYLSGGLYHFVWSTANIKDCAKGREFLVDHEGLY